jgi:hypothetical protein
VSGRFTSNGRLSSGAESPYWRKRSQPLPCSYSALPRPTSCCHVAVCRYVAASQHAAGTGRCEPFTRSRPRNSVQAGDRAARSNPDSCGASMSTTSVFDGQLHRGELIVHEEVVPQVITVFEQLYRLRYPIERIRTVDHYPAAADELSMEDNNTSAFNCRGIPGSDQWSQHAYGRTIDLNPLLNPFINGTGALQPKNSSAYLDRSRTDPGLLHDGDAAVHVFTDRGWRWGGYWKAPIDYQHFELP